MENEPYEPLTQWKPHRMKGPPTTFWGKLERDGDGPVTAWHPLLAHCADVAACAEALLERTILRERLARLGGLTSKLDEVTIARLACLAALHDIGKFGNGFQRKGDSIPTGTSGHVAEILSVLWFESTTAIPIVEALELRKLGSWCESGDSILDLLASSICHHGRPIASASINFSREHWQPSNERDPIAGMTELLSSVRRWFPRAFDSTRPTLPDAPALQHAFSGVIMLADWLGSDRADHMFPFAETLDDRMEFARDRARRAVLEMGLDPSRSRNVLGGAPVAFSSVSPFSPRAAQVATMNLPLSSNGSLTILESETGSGKTEASLIRFLRMFQAGLVDGLTFALPTRSAATQLHERIVRAIELAYPESATRARPAVVLAVPGYIRFDEQDGQRLPNFEVLWNDDLNERFQYLGWASEQPKRFLAGAIVVGTVDQVLMSSLRVSHAHLRASALLRHLLVVDEVHASDEYMTRILLEVLRFHLQAGGHAFLMSATLGSTSRERFEELVASEPSRPSTLEQALGTPYPVVHHSEPGGQTFLTYVESPGLPKSIDVRMESWADEPSILATHALGLARRGARVLILRNTVRDALETQLALEAHAVNSDAELLFWVNGRLSLHHARFSKDDRELLDHSIEARFGKSAPASPGIIAVATQTVQQSLDLDADVLMTDLAPMDVLLQRFGRVHRHRERDPHRPTNCKRALAIVLCGAPLDGSLRENGEAVGSHGLGRIYPNLLIVEATRRLFESHPTIRIPEQNRMLVELTTHPEAISALLEDLPEKWCTHRDKLRGEVFSHRGLAGSALMNRTAPFRDPECAFSSALGGRLMTRLGADDRRIRFEPAAPGPFGLPVRELRLPGWMARGTAKPDSLPEEITWSAQTQSFSFRFLDARYVYDRLGLRFAESPNSPP